MTATWWLFGLLALNGAGATDLFILGNGITDLAAPGGLLIGLGRLTGLYGALALVFQLVLVSRLPWLEARLGLDRLTGWHRWSGFWVLWLLLAHVVFITLGYSAQSNTTFLPQLGTIVFDLDDTLLAAIAFVLLILLGATSARMVRRRLRYENWHLVHICAYGVVVLAFLHQITIGRDFTNSQMGRIYWWSLYGGALAAVLLSRVALPLYRNLRHRLRVVSVVRESPSVVTVWIGGRRLDRWPARAGQFFLWRFLMEKRWREAHPYSLSAMPDGKYLRITVKALGDGSQWLQQVQPGTRVFAEGPYGAFTTRQRVRRHALLVAGGVGVTPIRALLEEFARTRQNVVVIYRASRRQDAILVNELHQLARVCGARLHVVLGSSAAVGRFGPMLGARHIVAMVPDVRDRDVFVCGPPPMTNVVNRALFVLGLPASQLHSERFAFAA
ncbi:MAG TPA: ferric reductase-like transmembrane domain-containing protein [Amycolatopsis sp.]|uniref:ferredoxin reductase family protein n=1 Tax=Amycolatopsis sp. TaxID=37632 RepID=UPI002B467055|nr:ferric reductase-like transmembrane domain-containing protein [Amycolatopsis sp.]HKS46549.1 ferric reductase-like transmembrane domain-containing protein [Amycolatopsis sp.]